MILGELKKNWKIELIISIIILLTIFYYSDNLRYETAVKKEMIKQENELKIFLESYEKLKDSRIKSKDIDQIIKNLNKIDRSDFILKYDLILLLAKAHSLKNDYHKAEVLYNKVIQNKEDIYSKIDAYIELAILNRVKGDIPKSIKFLESALTFKESYRKEDIYFYLAYNYYKLNNITNAGKVIIKMDDIFYYQIPIYEEIILSNWTYFTRNEKKKIFNLLAKKQLFNNYIYYLTEYITNYRPFAYEVESLILNVINSINKKDIERLLSVLKNDKGYLYIYNDLENYYNYDKPYALSKSAELRGLYFFNLLSRLEMKGYDYKKSYAYFKEYLKGEINEEYIIKNISFVIRAYLSQKKYKEINNLIEETYKFLNISKKIQLIDKSLSFWDGYAYFKRNEFQKALKSFESVCSHYSESYYSIIAIKYIDDILNKLNISKQAYIKDIEDRLNKETDIITRIYYSKLLFSLTSNNDKEKQRLKTLKEIKKIYPNIYFDFDENEMNKIKMNKNYKKFIIYTRLRIINKAKAMLSSVGISDETKQNLLFLISLENNNDYSNTFLILWDLENNKIIQENFAFLSRTFKTLLYPKPYEAIVNETIKFMYDQKIDKYLIYSVMRKESLFNKDARSRAGAIGLMQLMPKTAIYLAEKYYNTNKIDYYLPEVNITLGANYLNELISKFGLLEGLASYNGGNMIVKTTKEKYKPTSVIELIELIPLRETREYVIRVLQNYLRYIDIYNEKSIVDNILNIQL